MPPTPLANQGSIPYHFTTEAAPSEGRAGGGRVVDQLINPVPGPVSEGGDTPVPHLPSLAATPPPAIDLRGVAISFQLADGRRYDAVQPSNLSVAEGEFVAIVGPTGCGKSTLLNAAAGLLTPSAGTVTSLGRTVTGLNRDAGYLFQQDALMPWKTARDNVAIGLEVAGVARADAVAKAEAMLARVGLKTFMDRYPHQMSGGQRKRVALAQVLVRGPKILLMDEPFGPLDAQTRLIMGELLLGLWQADRKAVLFVTHDLDEAISLADRVVIMSAGPAATIIGDFAIDLPRPRDIAEIKGNPRFHQLHGQIWAALRDEVRKTYSFGE
jgi:NitT/TauT family transport system ATP-binding protein